MTTSIITRKAAGAIAAFAFLASSFSGALAPLAAHAADNAVTNPATGITQTDATLNGTNGDTDAEGHSFWVSTSTFSTATASPIPDGVYSTDDLGAIASNTPFSAQLSSANGLPAVTPNTTYYFAAWSSVGGTWYPGSVENFTTAAAPGNTAPVANDDSYSVDQDATLTVNAADGVLANDTDADSDAMTAATSTDVSNGTLTLNSDGSFTYVPDAGFTGTDSFTYMANDGTDNSNAATATITVNATGGGATPTTVTVTPNDMQGWTESSAAGGSAAIV
ncbi:MAG TPA: cadherin-like domain-containing protein, partial [Candidatus Paceibacterota bacterium]